MNVTDQQCFFQSVHTEFEPLHLLEDPHLLKVGISLSLRSTPSSSDNTDTKIPRCLAIPCTMHS